MLFKKQIFCFLVQFAIIFAFGNCADRLIYPDHDIVLQKLGLVAPTKNASIPTDSSQKVQRQPEKIGTVTNFTPPPTTYKPRRYKNCAWCCVQLVDTDDSYPTSHKVDFNDLPICEKCCKFQPTTEEDYNDEPDEDDKISGTAIATLLGKK